MQNDETRRYEEYMDQVVGWARTKFYSNVGEKQGWNLPEFDALDAANREIREARQARHKESHVEELGDALNFLIFEIAHMDHENKITKGELIDA